MWQNGDRDCQWRVSFLSSWRVSGQYDPDDTRWYACFPHLVPSNRWLSKTFVFSTFLYRGPVVSKTPHVLLDAYYACNHASGRGRCGEIPEVEHRIVDPDMDIDCWRDTSFRWFSTTKRWSSCCRLIYFDERTLLVIETNQKFVMNSLFGQRKISLTALRDFSNL